jgi:DNA helicase-2/ATP-dependent DNA helicase PcrA
LKKTPSSLFPDLERIAYLKELIDDLEKGSPLKRYRSDVYYEIKRMQGLITTMKREGYTRNHIHEAIDRYLEELPTREGYFYTRKYKENKIGDPKKSRIEEEVQKMNTLRAATDMFDCYQALMHKHNRYDFDDMINWVLSAFQKHPSLLLDLQEKFQFLLIDEYQDTSGTQNEIIRWLCSDIEQPNVFVVGDDDQSIYRFQGANVNNIMEYRNRYANDLKKIVLHRNYRSTQAILDVSQAIITNNKERMSSADPELIKVLSSSNPLRAELATTPELHQYENEFQELVGVTERVYQLIQQGVLPQQIAILYRVNEQGDTLTKFLRQRNIPFLSKKKENLFQISFAKKILTVLRYIATETALPYSGDALLFEILHYQWFNIPPFEIARASVASNDQRAGKGKRHSLRQYFQEKLNTRSRTLFDEEMSPPLASTLTDIEHWIQASLNDTVINLVELLYSAGGFLSFALAQSDKRYYLEILRAFMDFVKEEMHRHPEYTLQELLEVIDLMESQNVSIPLYRVYGTELGVQISTIHGSKGLEFKYVFLINTTSKSWEENKGKGTNYAMPDTLITQVDQNNKEMNLEEIRRGFFVALTRAEEYLYISWSNANQEHKTYEPSRFIAEIRETIALDIQRQTLSDEMVTRYLEMYLMDFNKPVIEELERDFMQSLIDKFEMNATALNNYLNCPLRFYYQNLIRVPSGKSESMTFGSAVHFALQRLFEKMLENQKEFPLLEECLQDFNLYMFRNRESFTREALERRKEYGTTILTEIYQRNIQTWSKAVSVERRFGNVLVEGVPIKGVVDKMEYEGNNVVLIDYKTGNPKNAGPKLKGPEMEDDKGGDYWRQGIFYKLLVEGDASTNYQVVSSTFEFLEPNEKGNFDRYHIIPTMEEMNKVRNQIRTVWDKIQQHDFYTGCGESDCDWCKFVKNTNQYVHWKEHEDS